jgi:hypothetical protein
MQGNTSQFLRYLHVELWLCQYTLRILNPSENWMCPDWLALTLSSVHRLASAVVCSGCQRTRLASFDRFYGLRLFTYNITPVINADFKDLMLSKHHQVLDM